MKSKDTEGKTDINNNPLPNSKKEKNLKKLAIVYFLCGITISLLLYFWFSNANANNEEYQGISTLDSTSVKTVSNDDLKKNKKLIDSTAHIRRVSDSADMKAEYYFDEKAGKYIRNIYSGKRINIAITGVDSRLGDNSRRADANHVLSILVDSGKIEMIAIPRDTPVDLGLPDSSGQNKLTVARQVSGRNGYLKHLAELAEVDQIHYYMEVGFSQALSVLDWLGYQNSTATLQVLRSRKGLGGDDFQRCYNQAQFIRQMILTHFEKVNGTLGNLLIPAGLTLVESNLNTQQSQNLIADLKKHGFPKGPESITISVKPPIGAKFKVYDFTNEKVINGLKSKIDYFNQYNTFKDTNYKDLSGTAEKKINYLIAQAILDSAKNPAKVVKNLSTFFNQRAWHQIQNKDQKANAREQFKILLSNAYIKLKKPKEAQSIIQAVEGEKTAFQNSIKKQ